MTDAGTRFMYANGGKDLLSINIMSGKPDRLRPYRNAALTGTRPVARLAAPAQCVVQPGSERRKKDQHK